MFLTLMLVEVKEYESEYIDSLMRELHGSTKCILTCKVVSIIRNL